MKKSIGANAILNTVRQVLMIAFPLITYPYALRVLGVDSIGQVTYAASVVSYFSLIAMTGIPTYAVREGARVRDDKNKISILANQLFTINLLFAICAVVLLALAIVFFPKLNNYRILIIIIGMQIPFNVIGVDWINSIYEDYLYLTIRSIICSVLSMFLLFALVKDASDTIWYALLTVAPTAVTCCMNGYYCRKYVRIRPTVEIDWKTHLKPLMILFANYIASTIYVNLDVTMLGLMKGDSAVGLYAASTKIYTLVKNVLIALFIVALPRLSFYAEKDDFEEYRNVFTKLTQGTAVILLPACVGLFTLSDHVIRILAGAKYIGSVISLKILCIALLFAIFGGLLTACVNVSIKKEKVNLQATFISATLNVVLNLFIIPRYSLNGAAFTTAFSELFVLLYCLLKLEEKRKYISFARTWKTLLKSSLACAVMVAFIYLMEKKIKSIIIAMIIEVAGGACVYFIGLLLLKESIVVLMGKRMLKKIGVNIGNIPF